VQEYQRHLCTLLNVTPFISDKSIENTFGIAVLDRDVNNLLNENKPGQAVTGGRSNAGPGNGLVRIVEIHGTCYYSNVLPAFKPLKI